MGSVGRAALLWLTAAFLAATWASEAQATGASRSGDPSAHLAQASTRDPAELQSSPDQGQQKAEMLARELAVARRDLEPLLNLLNKARDEQARAKQAADKEAAELRRALQEERDRGVRANQEADSSADELRKSMLRDRAERMERDLAAMRRGVEPQTAPSDSGTPDLRKSLQQERDRASRLEQDLAAARRDVETQRALAAKAKDEASKLKQARGSGTAELQKSLQQERDRAGRLEQDLAAARRDVETQTALAAKAKDEASKLKQAGGSGTAELQKSVEQEGDRAGRLEQNLAAARRDVEAQTALAAKAKDEASKLKQARDSGFAELQESLRQERDRASRLEQDLATARRDIETQTALAAKASDEASQVKKTVDAGAAELRKSLQQERDRAGRLEQDLVVARRDVETQTALVAKAGAEASQLKKTADGAAELRKSLQQERDRASRREQDLVAARRDVETQTALATKAGDQAVQLKQTAERGAAELKQALQQEQDKAATLAQELTTARARITVYEVQARRADDQAEELKQAEIGAEGLRTSLQQERDRASRLEQDLATARRDVEMQTTLAAKEGAEASQLTKAAEAGAADLQKSLQQERERAVRLEQDLSAARRDVETQTALAAKASDEAGQMKQAAESATDLQKSLQQERDKAEALAQDLSAARSKIYAYEAQARQVSDRAADLKQAESGAADLLKALQQGRERAEGLEQDLAAARRDVETQTALAAKASDEASQLKQGADSGASELRKSLQQERARAERLEEDLAAARRDIETQRALAAKAGDEASQLKQVADSSTESLRKSLQEERDRAESLARDLSTARTEIQAYEAKARQASDQAAESGTEGLRKSLQQEHDRATALAQELVAARRDVEMQTELAAKASTEASQLKKVADSGSAELRRSLQKEHDRAEALAQDLSMVHTAIYAYEAQARMASDQAAGVEQASEGSPAELRKSLVHMWEREARLQKDLAAVRYDLETQTALAAKARDKASQLKQTAERDSAGQRSSLQRERDRTARLERDLVFERSKRFAPAGSPVATTGVVTQPKPSELDDTRLVGEERAPPTDAQPNAADAAEVARLVARASGLLARGDIGSARIVLELAAETGSAQASFALAETYDPLILIKWGTYGTRGDAKKAQALYAKAEAGGIKEAKERLDALRR